MKGFGCEDIRVRGQRNLRGSVEVVGYLLLGVLGEVEVPDREAG